MSRIRRWMCLCLALSFVWGMTLATAAENPSIGSVVVTHTSSVNVREMPNTKAKKVHYISPRGVFPCLGIAENGWYQVMVHDYRVGYVSNKVTRLDRHTADLPLPLSLPKGEKPVPAHMQFALADPEVTVPQYLPEYQKAFVNGKYPVYTGPGEQYYRAANGRAMVGSTEIRVWGAEGRKGEWALIGYGTSDGGYRMGYVLYEEAYNLRFPQQFIANEAVRLPQDTPLTDDPIVYEVTLATLPAGTVVTVLAYLRGSYREYAMVEVGNYQGQPLRGFVAREYIPFY
jgi:hypothetical protein